MDKVRSIMLEVAQQTTTEISFTSPRCQVLQIVGREGVLIDQEMIRKWVRVRMREVRVMVGTTEE